MGISEQEVNFPRGGASSKSDQTSRKRKSGDVLFGTGVKKNKVAKSKANKTEGKPTASDKPSVWTRSITPELLTEGILGLGVVREIYDDHALLETTDNCRVRLSATQIGKLFIERLKTEELSMNDILSIGQFVPFRVLKSTTVRQRKNNTKGSLPEVTCDPIKLNAHLTPDRLFPGLTLHALVESKEEKGFVLDIGLQTMKAFLPFEKTSENKLEPGYLVIVRVESRSARILKVSSFVEQDVFSSEACEKLSLNYLMPGTIVECDPIVDEESTEGVYVTIGNVRAFVRRRHLPPRLRTDTSRLVKSFRSIVMFCQQNSHLLVLSAHPDLVSVSKLDKRKTFENFEVGDRITCTVMDVIPSKQRVIFTLPPDSNGKPSLLVATSSKSYLEQVDACEKHYKIGSQHVCRIMDFNYAERSLSVATKKDILQQKMVSYKDAVPGELVKATVTKVTSSGISATIFGHVRGYMPSHLISDRAVSVDKSYPKGKIFTCRILNVDIERKQVTITAKEALVKNHGVKINAYSNDFVGKTSVGIISKIFPTGALLILFYNRVCGIVPAVEAKELGSKAIKDRSIEVKVSSVDEVNKKMNLVLNRNSTANSVIQKNETAKGSKLEEINMLKESNPQNQESVQEAVSKRIKNFHVYSGTVIGVWDYKEVRSHFCVKVKLPGDKIGRLHVSEFPESLFMKEKIVDTFLQKYLSKKINVKVIGFTSVRCGVHKKERVVELTMNESKILDCRIKAKILGYQQKFRIGDVIRCFIRNNSKTANVEVEINPMVIGHIPRVVLENNMIQNPTTEGSLVDCEFPLGHLMHAVVKSYSRNDGKIVLDLSLEEKNNENRKPISKNFEFGQSVTGRIINVNYKNLCVMIQLSSGQQALLTPTAISENYEKVHTYITKFHKGELFSFYSLRKDDAPRRYFLITEGRYKQHMKKIESDEPNALFIKLKDVVGKIGKTLHGFLCYNSGGDYSLVEVAPGIHGVIKKNQIVRDLPLNSVLEVKIKDFDSEQRKLFLTFQKVLFTPTKQVQQKPLSLNYNTVSKETVSINSNVQEELGEKIAVCDPGFEWENIGFTPEEMASVGKIDSILNLEEASNMSVPAKDDNANEKIQFSTSLNKKMMECDDFDRLLRKNPDSAETWINYMTYFLTKGDLEKTRGTAERALSAINYREETEIFNIWTAYLNLEVAYGDSTSIKAIFDRACGNADALKIHKQMASIFVSNKKLEEADEIFNVMIRKFRASSDEVWYLYADFLMSTERVQEARDLLQRALSSVAKSQHAQLINRFAQLEFSKGDAERGQTLFESLVTAYPKKTDIWMVYADLSLKYNGIESARNVLERACNLHLSMHKLRPLFKKWTEFEERHGDEKSLQLVLSLAEKVITT